ncbi:ABL122Cp [Eremothecium gossypii ATCC 10895]|uniref:ABL122Cp n=1 Tax=Eremothecium gossypii (strain ATCC 10895 / CBS 109.51 / FGSC 9923 / NRRL Y-1056) TaxID=284811 RepID=Q75DZ5_EREGS|nr:ABL122Cp [Eremothecium gossypii ATCC 10895]AAS50649.2 ABL122Cp [Eremothecium gossypii ATCC 10895]AEY94937.1 FABL122Cp [Eremothecium gossypii FDAG1]
MTNYQRLGPLGQAVPGPGAGGQPASSGPAQGPGTGPGQPARFFPGAEGMSLAAGSMPPVPQTPFDPTYGASLLPSHMLMGSPFLSTPLRPQAHFHPSTPGHSSHSLHHAQSARSSFLYYPQPPMLKPIPPRRKKSVTLNHSEPYHINFKILPKGKDEYMTRSLLLTNLEMLRDLDIHNFLNSFVKFGPVESIYLMDDNHSILLSFLTKATCLDFYNNLLQRFSEFKTKLHSPKLSVSFVCQDESSWFKYLQMNVVTRGATRSLTVEFEDSVKELNEDFVRLKFPWLFCSQRFVLERIDLINATTVNQHFGTRYMILHFISISMALEVDDFLQQPSQKRQLNISRIQFVNVNGHHSKLSDEEAVAAANGLQQDSRTSSVSSISLSISNTADLAALFHSLDLSLDTLSLQVVPSEYPTPLIEQHSEHLTSITISRPSKTLGPSASLIEMDSNATNAGNHHGVSSSLSGVLFMNDPSSSGSTPMIVPSELNLNTPVMGGPMQGQLMPGPPQPMSLHNPSDGNGGSPSYFMDPMVGAPIGQTLQRQYLAGASQANGINNRTVYIGNIHPRSKPEDICNVVRGGILQTIKWISSKRICFVTFIETAAAVQFYANASLEPIVLHGNILRVGWGQPSGELPKNIALAVTIGASRNVYVSLPEYSFKEKYINNPEFKLYHGKYKLPTEEQLRQDFTKYGQVEQINYLEDGHCCWVNFMNIAHAIRLVEDSNSPIEKNLEKFHAQFDGRYKNLIIGYGKDRCGNVNKNLAANKNSRFYKKIKKQSYSMKQGKQPRKEDGIVNSDDLTKNNEVLPGVQMNSSKNGGVGESQSLVGDQELAEGLGISLTSAQISPDTGHTHHYSDGVEEGDECDDDDAGYSTSGSSDIDIIVAPPDEFKRRESGTSSGKHKKKSKSTRRNQHSNAASSASYNQQYSLGSLDHTSSAGSLDAPPPLAPSSMQQHLADRRPRHTPGRSTDSSASQYNSQTPTNANYKSRRRRQAKFSKPIAGQDVMSQYLEQLHHSTFLYATNILGATTVQEPLGGYYDSNGNEQH